MTAGIFRFTEASLARQEWLEKAAGAVGAHLQTHGYEVPRNVRISIGFPKGGGGERSKTVGQCWYSASSADKHNEIFISPELGDTKRIMGVIAHELIHAVLGPNTGHKSAFKRAAMAIGLCGKMTSTEEGPTFIAWAIPVIEDIGQYPAEGCGYTVRTTSKWIEESGAPICPVEMEPMLVAGQWRRGS